AAFGTPPTFKIWQVSQDLLKRNTIAAVVSPVSAKGYRTARKSPSDDLCNLANPIILRIVADIENLVVNLIAGCFERERNGLADVLHVHERAPRSAVARHLDFLYRPCKSREIVKDDIKTHSRACAEGGRVAKENRREGSVRHRSDIALDHQFT